MKNIFRIIALFLVLGLALPNSAFASELDDRNKKVVATFGRITMPRIERMAPYISKTNEERKAAAIALKIQVGGCSNGDLDAFFDYERAAVDATALCGAMENWLLGNEAATCVGLRRPPFRPFFSGPAPVPPISRKLNLVLANRIVTEMMSATGCGNKDAQFWAKKVISDYKQMYDLIKSTPKENYSRIKQTIQELEDDCVNANFLREKFSILAESTSSGCDAIHHLVVGTNPCVSIFAARWHGERAPANDPLKDDWPLLRESFNQLSEKTGCQARVQELYAQYGAPKQVVMADPKTQEQIAQERQASTQAARSAATVAFDRELERRYNLYIDAHNAREVIRERWKNWAKRDSSNPDYFGNNREEIMAQQCRFATEMHEAADKLAGLAYGINSHQPNDRNQARLDKDNAAADAAKATKNDACN